MNSTTEIYTRNFAFLEDFVVLHYSNFPYFYILLSCAWIYLIYWIFCVPYVWIKTIDETGFDLAMRHERKSSKKHTINRLRRLRRWGELPPVFPNGWYGIFMSKQLKPGGVVNVSCLGENFVVFRAENGAVHVLDAFCPHLGANMGVGGRVVGDCIECPFHNWKFRGSDGTCKEVPYSNSVPSPAKVRKWISNEVNEYIFVWYHADPEVKPWQLPVEDKIDELAFVGYNEFYVNCHCQEIPENGADVAHFNAVHRDSILAQGGKPADSKWANFGRHKWFEPSWTPMEAPNKHLCQISLTHYMEVTPKLQTFELKVTGQQIGPAYVALKLTHILTGDIYMLQTVTPIEPLVQKVVHRFYSKPLSKPLAKCILCAESIMFERDINMWNSKMYLNNPILVKEDSKLKQFRLWYSQFYSSNSKRISAYQSGYDW